MRERYSEKEAEEILWRATVDDPSDISREQLYATARELGISAEQLRRAEESYVAEQEAKQDSLRRKLAARRDFLIHFFVYCAVNGGLGLIDFLEDGKIDFVFFPMIAWGIGLVIHAYSAMFFQSSEPALGPAQTSDSLIRSVTLAEPAAEEGVRVSSHG